MGTQLCHLTDCETLDEIFNFLKPQFPWLYNEEHNGLSLKGWKSERLRIVEFNLVAETVVKLHQNLVMKNPIEVSCDPSYIYS